jgi:hypothetical protein
MGSDGDVHIKIIPSNKHQFWDQGAGPFEAVFPPLLQLFAKHTLVPHIL